MAQVILKRQLKAKLSYFVKYLKILLLFYLFICLTRLNSVKWLTLEMGKKWSQFGKSGASPCQFVTVIILMLLYVRAPWSSWMFPTASQLQPSVRSNSKTTTLKSKHRQMLKLNQQYIFCIHMFSFSVFSTVNQLLSI